MKISHFTLYRRQAPEGKKLCKCTAKTEEQKNLALRHIRKRINMYNKTNKSENKQKYHRTKN